MKNYKFILDILLVFLNLVNFISCAHPQEPLVVGEMQPPLINIKAPAIGPIEAKSGEMIDIVGSIVIDEKKQWLPESLTVNIYKEVSNSKKLISITSKGMMLDQGVKDGNLKFEVNLRSPMKAGKYVVRVECNRTVFEGKGANQKIQNYLTVTKDAQMQVTK